MVLSEDDGNSSIPGKDNENDKSPNTQDESTKAKKRKERIRKEIKDRHIKKILRRRFPKLRT